MIIKKFFLIAIIAICFFPSKVLALTSSPAVEEAASATSTVVPASSSGTQPAAPTSSDPAAPVVDPPPATTADTSTTSTPTASAAAAAVPGSAGGSAIPTFNSTSVNVDPQTGSASSGIAIVVPAGRAGIQPELALVYNSNIKNGMAGMGWNLELGAIQLLNKRGIPKYDGTDIFIYTQNGSVQELVKDPSGFYHPEVEGAFMKMEFVDNTYWLVTDKKGTKYYFGQNNNSRVYDNTVGNALTFKWCLERVEDINGNYMTVEYTRDISALYPKFIYYTGNTQGPLPTFARVNFDYETRPDQFSVYLPGFKLLTRQRLKTISTFVDVGGNSKLQTQYVLNYSQSRITSRSLLTSMVQYGSDGLSSLPPVTFNYQDAVRPSYTLAGMSGNGDFANSVQNNMPRYYGDFNADGKTDIALLNTSTGQVDIAYSNGAGFLPKQGAFNGVSGNIILLTGDIDRDGYTDFIKFDYSTGEWRVTRMTASGSSGDALWNGNFGAGKSPGVGDFDADGYIDIYVVNKVNNQFEANFALNRYGQFQILPTINPVIGYGTDNPFAADFNGDGLTDFGSANLTTEDWQFRMNTGTYELGYQLEYEVFNFSGGVNFVAGDYDYDGLTDIGYFNQNTHEVIYKKFSEITQPTSYNLPIVFNTSTTTTQIQAADFNGDGIPDFTAHNANNYFEIAYSSGENVDLLTAINNGLGGVTTIDYDPSSNYANNFMPFVIDVVKSVTVSDSRGSAYSTQYVYAGGLWSTSKREFRGFAQVTVKDPLNNMSITNFMQDDIYKGRVSSQESRDSQNNLFAKSENTWNSRAVFPGINFVYLESSDSYVYDGNPSGHRTRQSMEYDAYGNVTKVTQLGEVNLATGNDIGADTRFMETQYFNNTQNGNWLLGLPKTVIKKRADGAITQQAWFYYDAATNQTALPIKGQLTQKEDWAGAGQNNPKTKYSYDAYGNLKTATDPLNHTSTVSYDSTYNIFPLATTNTLGHQVTNEYYGVNGVALDDGAGLKGLWSQQKSVTDPNGQKALTTYDTLGRAVASISPLDSVQYPTAQTQYTFGSNTTKITSKARIKHGQGATLESYQFYDGLGRLIQSKSPSAAAGKYIVNGQTEYNSRGLPEKKYVSFFSTNPVDTLEPIDSNRLHTTITYDAMGRAVRTDNPDGSYANVIIDDWATQTIDENGHSQKAYSDAYGRLVKREEMKGADGRGAPAYPLAAFSVYATTNYVYDTNDNLVNTMDHQGHVTVIKYDTLGRKINMTDPDMHDWQYTYDANGNLKTQIDAKGQTITFTYDALNRLTNKTDQGELNVNYTYDDPLAAYSKGRLTKVTYGASGDKTEFFYDKLGRETRSVKTIDTNAYSVTRSYDALNRLESLEYPNAAKVYYKYNLAGQAAVVSKNP